MDPAGVCAPATERQSLPEPDDGRADPESSLPGRLSLIICFAVALLAFLAYARALQLPFIADDYDQITKARDYAPPSGWAALLHDVLYRCRATSLFLTYWTEQWFGTKPFVFNLSSLLIHIVNSLLVLALGFWKRIGWKISAVAACVFAVSQRHHEAVIWYAALPELMVFFFVLLSFLCWLKWLEAPERSEAVYLCAFAAYVLALFSKESAVAVPPLLLMAGLIDGKRLRLLLVRILPFVLCAITYFGLIFAARKTHLHFNDVGTFSLTAPFPLVLLRSGIHLIGPWGLVAIIGCLIWKPRHRGRVLIFAACWLVIALLPYCFLSYMPEVPSRHTYLASLAVALLLSVWLMEMHLRIPTRYRTRAMAAIAVLFIVHQCGYLWIRKQHQFAIRAEPTERLLKLVSDSKVPIAIKCFPYGREIADMALRVRGLESTGPAFVFDAGDTPNAVDFCFDPGQYVQRPSR